MVLDPIGDKTVRVGQHLEFTVQATDSIVHPLWYTSPEDAPGVFVDHGDGTGTYSWDPTDADIRNHRLLLAVTDGSLSDSEQVSIHVIPAYPPPEVITPGNVCVEEGDEAAFSVLAVAADGLPVNIARYQSPNGALGDECPDDVSFDPESSVSSVSSSLQWWPPPGTSCVISFIGEDEYGGYDVE